MSSRSMGCSKGGDEDPAQPRIDAVAQGEVDDSVRTAEIDRRFRAFLGEGEESLTGPAGQQDDENVVEVHGSPKGGDVSTQPSGRLMRIRHFGPLFRPVGSLTCLPPPPMIIGFRFLD